MSTNYSKLIAPYVLPMNPFSASQLNTSLHTNPKSGIRLKLDLLRWTKCCSPFFLVTILCVFNYLPTVFPMFGLASDSHILPFLLYGCLTSFLLPLWFLHFVRDLWNRWRFNSQEIRRYMRCDRKNRMIEMSMHNMNRFDEWQSLGKSCNVHICYNSFLSGE